MMSNFLKHPIDFSNSAFINLLSSLVHFSKIRGTSRNKATSVFQVEFNSTREPSSFANALFCFVLFGVVTSCRVAPDVFRKYLQILRKAKSNGKYKVIIFII